MNKLLKRGFCSRQQETAISSDDLDFRASPKDGAFSEATSGKDVAFSLSIDSSVTAESVDLRQPQIPVLHREQYPPVRPATSRMLSIEEGPYDLDFFAALKST